MPVGEFIDAEEELGALTARMPPSQVGVARDTVLVLYMEIEATGHGSRSRSVPFLPSWIQGTLSLRIFGMGTSPEQP